ncbi:MAG: branched-chain amino acid transaminase [Nitrosopumilus sp.]|nr:branched-chain amino acid transaminase [Nitrosopumilus sp.]
MRQTGKIWMDGRLVPFRDARVHVLTHALHYSTSVFEGLRCYRARGGPAVFRMREHVARLFRSAALYSMRMRYTEPRIGRAILDTVRANRLQECYIRPLAYCGFGEMGLTPTKNRVDVSISCWKWGGGEYSAGRSSGAKCRVSSWRKIGPGSQPMQAKAASNYGNAALARMEALRDGYDEAIMLNEMGMVAEGSAENVFAVRDGAIYTPPLSAGGLDGITRDSVMEIALADGYDVAEMQMSRDDLYSADEVFMTGTAAEVRSVAEIDGIKIGDGRVGPATKGLQKSFADVARGRDERFSEWLTPV